MFVKHTYIYIICNKWPFSRYLIFDLVLKKLFFRVFMLQQLVWGKLCALQVLLICWIRCHFTSCSFSRAIWVSALQRSEPMLKMYGFTSRYLPQPQPSWKIIIFLDSNNLKQGTGKNRTSTLPFNFLPLINNLGMYHSFETPLKRSL